MYEPWKSVHVNFEAFSTVPVDARGMAEMLLYVLPSLTDCLWLYCWVAAKAILSKVLYISKLMFFLLIVCKLRFFF